MEDNFRGVEVGEIDAIQVKVDDVIYNLWGVKDPNCVMRMMTTDGRLLEDYKFKETVIRWKGNGEDVVNNFKYKLPFDWNFCYQCSVDDHNNLRHALKSIEDTCMTDWWECQIFAFILSISKVHTFFILRHFVYFFLRQEVMPEQL